MPVGSFKAQDAASPIASRHALDWVNFFLAALLMGFGPFVSVHLANRGWTPEGIGLVLTVSGLVPLHNGYDSLAEGDLALIGLG